jgi:3'-phosphoadenosine 5'-phosphosulfate (PAPS) 3'-phosphatase
MSLINNKADLYLHTSKIYKWDICAPNAILNNYGGKLTKRDGRPVDYSDTRKEALSVDGIIAAVYNYNYFYSIFKKTSE